LLEMDNVHLEFEDDALIAIAKKALERETGARGLRAIVENLLTNIMYDVPSSSNVERCIITKATVENGEPPKLVINEDRQPIYRKPRARRARRAATGAAG